MFRSFCSCHLASSQSDSSIHPDHGATVLTTQLSSVTVLVCASVRLLCLCCNVWNLTLYCALLTVSSHAVYLFRNERSGPRWRILRRDADPLRWQLRRLLCSREMRDQIQHGHLQVCDYLDYCNVANADANSAALHVQLCQFHLHDHGDAIRITTPGFRYILRSCKQGDTRWHRPVCLN